MDAIARYISGATVRYGLERSEGSALRGLRERADLREVTEGSLNFSVTDPVDEFQIRLQGVQLVRSCLEKELEAEISSYQSITLTLRRTHSYQDVLEPYCGA